MLNQFYSTTEAAVNPAPLPPDPSWIVGVCPLCEGPLVRNRYYTGGVGYRTLNQCWSALDEQPTCPVWDADKYVETHFQESHVMEPTLTETPAMLTAAAALAICDDLIVHNQNRKSEETRESIEWFRLLVEQGRAGFCKCGMPTLGAVCLVCTTLGEARRFVGDDPDEDCIEHYRSAEARDRDVALCRRDLIRKLKDLEYYAVIAADCLAYCDAGAAAERMGAEGMKVAA